MGKITFIEHDGTEHVVEFEAGASLMQIAVDNMIPGIDADCGGECACGTCHVIVADECPRARCTVTTSDCTFSFIILMMTLSSL